MSYSLVDMVLKSPITDPTEVAVLVALASFSDKYCSCYPSTQALCDRSRYKERAVQGAVKRLTERGILSVKIGRGRGGANFYTIHPGPLKPAADAAIDGPKTRSKCGITRDKNPHLTTEKPASDDVKPAADADEYTKEPVKNPAAREAGLGKDRIQSMRDSIVHALGLTGRELNTSGTFVVAGMDPHNLEASLIVWAAHGLTDAQILTAIRGKLASERAKDSGFMPRSLKLFDGPISDFAKRLTGTGSGARPQAPTFSTPEAEAEKREIDREWAAIGDRADREAEAQRQKLMDRYRNLQARQRAS